MLSFRSIKQTSKNVANTTFKNGKTNRKAAFMESKNFLAENLQSTTVDFLIIADETLWKLQ